MTELIEAASYGNFLLIYICNFHVLSHFLLIYICKLHWNQGLISEELLSKCLVVNDAIMKTLEAEQNGTKSFPDDMGGLYPSNGIVSSVSVNLLDLGTFLSDLHMKFPCLKSFTIDLHM